MKQKTIKKLLKIVSIPIYAIILYLIIIFGIIYFNLFRNLIRDLGLISFIIAMLIFGIILAYVYLQIVVDKSKS